MEHQRDDLVCLDFADRCDQGMHDLHTAEGGCWCCACGQVRRLNSPTSAGAVRARYRTGRLGRDPSFRTSPRVTLVGRFPLAVHREDGTTVWHSILAFESRAEQLQHRSDAGELAKGREVSLIGYQHTREQPTRDGRTKTVTEIYAVAVTRR